MSSSSSSLTGSISKLDALPSPGKRVAAAALVSSSDVTTPTCSVKRLKKRVSIESPQDVPKHDGDATTTALSSLSSSKACSTDRSASSSSSSSTTSCSACRACQCHQHHQQQQQVTGCVMPTANNMAQNNVHHRQQDTSSVSAAAAAAAAVLLPSQKTSSSTEEEEDEADKTAAKLVWEHVGYNSTSCTTVVVGSDSSSSSSHDDDNNNNLVSKRQDYISWDDYFMSVAALSSFRSKDPHQPSGCCLVDSRHRIVGIGYNGFPAHCSDDCLPWSSTSSASSSGNDDDDDDDKIWLHTKYPYVCHAEVNAILNKCSADIAERGARLYVLDFPCNECAKVIIQAGLSEVIFLRDQEPDSLSSRASRLMFLQAGVKMRCHEPERMCIDLEFGQFLDSSADDKNGHGGSASSTSTTCIPTTTTTATTPTLQQQQHRDLMLLEAKDYDPCKLSSGKRTDYISWDDYYMAVAFLTAQRSKDPSTQVGAIIVDLRQRIVGLGYNGFPAGCSDDHLPWARTTNNNNPLHTKYPYVCHAEMNAILNKCTTDISGATLYVALFPCNECTKLIIQAGIRQVVYMSDKYHDTDSCRASRIMLQMADVKMRKYVPSRLFLSIHLGGPKP